MDRLPTRGLAAGEPWATLRQDAGVREWERVSPAVNPRRRLPDSIGPNTVWMWLHQHVLMMLGVTRAEDEALEEKLVAGSAE